MQQSRKKMPKPNSPEENDEFIFCDILGNHLKEGDPAGMARASRSTAVLRLIMIGKIEKFNKIVKQHYQVVGSTDRADRDTYFRLDYSQSGKRDGQVMGIKDVEFQIDKPEFARLFMKQVDYSAANPPTESEDDQ